MSTKTEKKSLQLVLNKAQEEQKMIGNKVRGMKAFIESEQQQEQSLQEYQNEYLEKIRGQKNISISEINRYRSFCQQLEQALTQQREKIYLAGEKLQALQKMLVQQQHKITILIDLIAKKDTLIQQEEDKVSQKISDELSSRRILPSL